MRTTPRMSMRVADTGTSVITKLEYGRVTGTTADGYSAVYTPRHAEGTDRQPGRDRGTGGPGVPGCRARLGGGVRRLRPERATRTARRRGVRTRRRHIRRDVPAHRQTSRRR